MAGLQLCCKNLCCASRFCTGGRGAGGSKSKNLLEGGMKEMLAQGTIWAPRIKGQTKRDKLKGANGAKFAVFR